MKNIHISLTEFRNESRVLKEINSLNTAELFKNFYVIALGVEDLKEKETISDNFQVKRLKLRSRSLPKSIPFQVIKFVEFMFRCFFIVWREKADVVNLHTLSLLPFGWLLKKLLGVKLVYDAHELETEKNGLRGIRKKASKWVEKQFIGSCDLVIVVGENIADWYAKTYSIERPLVVKNAPRLRNRFKMNLFRETLNILSEQKICLYQGGLMKGRGVQLILDAFKLRPTNDVVVVFMGYGDLEQDVKEAEYTNNNIRFHPAVHPGVVLDYTSSADFGISIIEKTCLSYYFCMPNKLFEYAMSGLPVIVSNMKEMAQAVETSSFGAVLKECSADSINEVIDVLIAKDLNKMSDRAHQFASAHSWEHQEEIMLKGYQRMLQA